jgi:signal transduction histidine kinase
MLWEIVTMIQPLESDIMAPADPERLFRHLAHELRQPLSGIESIAFYLDMVLGDADPALQQHCERLRRMVQHAHWLLEDTTLAVRLASTPPGPVDLRSLFESLGAELALHEERNLELRFAPAIAHAHLPAGLARQFFDHLLAFYRNLAHAEDPICVTLHSNPDSVFVTITALVQADSEDLPRTIDPPGRLGGIRQFVHSAGGQIQFTLQDETLTTSIVFPAAQ